MPPVWLVDDPHFGALPSTLFQDLAATVGRSVVVDEELKRDLLAAQDSDPVTQGVTQVESLVMHRHDDGEGRPSAGEPCLLHFPRVVLWHAHGVLLANLRSLPSSHESLLAAHRLRPASVTVGTPVHDAHFDVRSGTLDLL